MKKAKLIKKDPYHRKQNFAPSICNCGFMVPLLDFKNAPSFVLDNPFIISGYRSQLSFTDCIKSIFVFHNETLNIWTHLIGTVVFLLYLLYAMVFIIRDESFTTKLIFGISSITVISIYFSSALYHTFKCHSAEVYELMLSLDMGSIALGISGLTSSACYFGFYCYPNLQIFYGIFPIIFGILLWIATVVPNVCNYSVRLVLFVIFTGFGIIPLIHWTIIGFGSKIVQLFLWRIVVMYLLFGCGFAIWQLRIPERWFIGKHDIWFSSHQIWHIFVMLGPGFLLQTSIDILHFSRFNPCPII